MTLPELVRIKATLIQHAESTVSFTRGNKDEIFDLLEDLFSGQHAEEIDAVLEVVTPQWDHINNAVFLLRASSRARKRLSHWEPLLTKVIDQYTLHRANWAKHLRGLVLR